MAETVCEPQHVVDRATKLIQVGPGKGHQHTASVIFIHGFGDNAAGWFEPAMWWAERLPHVRFVLPTAPVSRTMGATSWFDFGGGDTAGTFAASTQSLNLLLRKEEAAVGASRVVVAGFSQGGALAYHLALTRSQQPLGGAAALSTFLRQESIEQLSEVSKPTPILICHGTVDDRIPGGAEGARQAVNRLRQRGVEDVELKIYEGMGHSATDVELLDILHWFRRVLPDAGLANPSSRL